MLRRHTLLMFVLLACRDGGTGPGNARDPRIRWVFDAGMEISYASPALSPDEGTVFVGTSAGFFGSGSSENALIALDVATGALKWRFATGTGDVRSSPAVADDGSITFLVEQRAPSATKPRFEIVRVSPLGTLAWRRTLGAPGASVDVGFSAPTLGVDGSVYIATDSLYKLTPAGEVAWTTFHTGEELRASAALGADGTVYFASHNVPLSALDPLTGDTLWTSTLGVSDHNVASPAVGADGAIYVATNECVLYAVEPTGGLRWSFDATSLGSPCAMRSSPAIGSDGSIYLGTKDRAPAAVMLALKPDGTLRWAFLPPNLPADLPYTHTDIYSSPAIGADGLIYFGQEFGRIYALDAATGTEEWMVRTNVGITWSSPVITSGGVLIINDLGGRVYALTTGNSGLDPAAPWPRYRGSNRSAGRR